MYIQPQCVLAQKLTLTGAVTTLQLQKQIGLEEYQAINGSVKMVEIVLEPNALATAGAILGRYLLTGDDPTDTDGMPIRAFDKITVSSLQAITSLRIKSVDGNNHILQAQYFNF